MRSIREYHNWIETGINLLRLSTDLEDNKAANGADDAETAP